MESTVENEMEAANFRDYTGVIPIMENRMQS